VISNRKVERHVRLLAPLAFVPLNIVHAIAAAEIPTLTMDCKRRARPSRSQHNYLK
jgi:hypothetical protein